MKTFISLSIVSTLIFTAGCDAPGISVQNCSSFSTLCVDGRTAGICVTDVCKDPALTSCDLMETDGGVSDAGVDIGDPCASND